MTEQKQELLPCPFCGGRDLSVTHVCRSDYQRDWFWRVECDDCDAKGGGIDNESSAVEFWNRRAAIPPRSAD